MVGIFRRFQRHVDACLDGMISKIENHEALVEKAVRGLEASLVRHEREHARVALSNERLREAVAEEHEAVTNWRERAIREPTEARGVECLRRSKRAVHRVRELAERLQENKSLEERLASRVAVLARELAEFREQDTLLRARQSRTNDPAEPRAPKKTPARELVELFARWEARVTESEITNDSLWFELDMDDEPRDAAEEAALVLELRELKENAR